MKQMFDSLERLEETIKSAKCMLEEGGTSADLLRRVNSYEEILDKQKNLARALCFHAKENHWDEVVRIVKIMNGLSQMMRDDALEVAYGLEGGALSEELGYFRS